MALEPGNLQDEDYNSASDHDFDPDAPKGEGDEDHSSSDDSDVEASAKTKKRKNTAEDLDFDNSGDEATISKAKRRKQKVGLKDEDDEEAGEGGLVKTRAQRRAEVLDRKPVIQAGKASVNVDDLWAQMSVAPKSTGATASTIPHELVRETVLATGQDDASKVPESSSNPSPKPPTNAVDFASLSHKGYPPGEQNSNGEATITIKRTYEFAGQKMEEDRVVPISSAEAKLYIEEQSKKDDSSHVNSKPSIRRPKKRTSMFDTTSTGSGNAIPGQPGKGPKLNTLEKSKLDWAAHVDHEGISEELDEHRRAKEGYLGRMDFLGRMDAKREEELRSLKPK